MPKLLRRFLWKAFLYLGLPAAAVLGAYGLWMKSRLAARLEKEGVEEHSIASFSLVDPKEAGRETSWPRVVRVAVKGDDGTNWRVTPRGLVLELYDWSPGGNEWLAVEPSLEEQARSLALRRLELQLPGQHMEHLSDADPLTREAASALLRARTGQDFGYRHDRPPETQKDSIARWRAWWEEHKLRWTAGKVIEAGKEILEKR